MYVGSRAFHLKTLGSRFLPSSAIISLAQALQVTTIREGGLKTKWHEVFRKGAWKYPELLQSIASRPFCYNQCSIYSFRFKISSNKTSRLQPSHIALTQLQGRLGNLLFLCPQKQENKVRCAHEWGSGRPVRELHKCLLELME